MRNRTGRLLIASAIACALAASPALADFYVRGDGSGSNSYSGADWANAFATIDKAYDSVPYGGTATTIYVQATGAGEAGDYDVAHRSLGYSSSSHDARLTVNFEGGYTNVDAAPAQSGVSVVKDLDGTVDEAGIYLYASGHGDDKTFSVNRFSFSDVTRGIHMDQSSGSDNSAQLLTLQNVDIAAQSHGVYINYPKGYASSSYGDPARLNADTVNVKAGLGGSGYGVYIRGSYDGTSIGTAGDVCSVTGASGGVYLSALNNETNHATFENLVVYDCGGDGIYLDNRRDASTWYRAQATLENCTLADNAGDGLHIMSRTSSSWANVTDSIFSANAAHGIHLGESGYSNFTCTENHNVFNGDDILVNGNPQALDATDYAANPLFAGTGDKPHPFYKIGSSMSPAYLNDTDGLMRGAIQDVPPAATLRHWEGDTDGKWNAAGFDDAGTNNPTTTAEIAVFGAGTTTAICGVGPTGPTVGGVRFESDAVTGGYTLSDGGAAVTLDGSALGGTALLIVADDQTHAVNAALSLASNLLVEVAAGGTVNLHGAVTGAASLTKTGPGTLGAANTGSSYSGGTSVDEGVLLLKADVGAAGTNSPVGTGALALNGGTLSADGTRAVSRNVALSTDSTVGGPANGDLTISGNVTGAHTLTMDGTGSVTLSGTNAHGDTVVDSGTLKLASAGALGSGNATVNGGRLDVDAALTAAAVTVNNGQLEVNAPVAADSLAIDGGVTNVNAASSATAVTVTNGTLNLNGVDLAAATMEVTAGTVNGGDSVVISDQLKLESATLTISPGDTFKASGTITKDGAEKITLLGGTLTASSGPALPAGVVAHYSFDDGGALGNDDSGNGYTASVHGGASYTAAGKIGGAATFDGNGDYLRADAVSGGVNNRSITVSGWIKTSSTAQQFAIAFNTSSGGNRFMAGLASGNTRYQLYDTSAWRDSGAAVRDNTWHHIGWTIDTAGNVIGLIVDGSVVTSYGSGSEVGSTDRFSIGMEWDSGSTGDYWNGLIDEVLLFGRKLDTTEIQALYDAGVAGSYGGDPVPFNGLGGVGTVVGDCAVHGALEPGLSVGPLVVDGNLTMPAGSLYLWELGDGVNDLIDVTGDLVLEDGWGLRLLDAGAGSASGDFLLFNYGGTADVGTVVFDPASAWDTDGLTVFDDGAGSIFLRGLSVAPIPEPASAVLLLLGLAGRRRRRR